MKKTIQDVPVKNQRVLVRVDFNVPVENGLIINDLRIQAALPTIQYLIEQQARIILLSHLGRPAGYVVELLRMNVVAQRLADILNMPVGKVNNCIGPEVEDGVRSLKPGQVMMLENVRFHPGEMVNDAHFAARLAAHADLFVNDAFAVAHRAHASTVGVARYLPAVAGLLMEKELTGMRRIQSGIRHPSVSLLGGARLIDKVHFIDNQLREGSKVLLGGVLANTFLRAKGLETGQSDVEKEVINLARTLLHEGRENLLLPVDVVVIEIPAREGEKRVVPVEKVPPSSCIVDIGPETVARYSRALNDARTVIWNGPLGMVEQQPFSAGTRAMIQKMASLEDTVIIAGGGETIAALELAGFTDRLDYLSTGGSAFLTALEKAPLPAVKALLDKGEQDSFEAAHRYEIEGQANARKDREPDSDQDHR